MSRIGEWLGRGREEEAPQEDSQEDPGRSVNGWWRR